MTLPIVAVTGATGFIGQNLLRALTEAGHQVRALTRQVPLNDCLFPKGRVSWVRGSLSQKEALHSLLDSVDAVVHCAGAVKALSRESFFTINGAGVRDLADVAAMQSNPPRLIYLSSLVAREPSLSTYAASKRLGEQMLCAFRDKLPIIILRPPVVYGPGDMETLRIFKMAAYGFVPIPKVSGARMSLVHVEDVIGAIFSALELDALPDGPIEFDDGRPKGYTWPEIATAAGSVLRISPRLISVPIPILYLFGVAGSLGAALSRRPNVISWGKVSELLHPDWVAQTCSLPGYNPLWNIEKGFENTVNWYTSRGLLKSNV